MLVYLYVEAISGLDYIASNARIIMMIWIGHGMTWMRSLSSVFAWRDRSKSCKPAVILHIELVRDLCVSSYIIGVIKSRICRTNG